MKRISQNLRKKLLRDAGFAPEYGQNGNEYNPPFASMTWHHRAAQAFTHFVSVKCKVYCYLELPEKKTKKRADCFIIPTSINARGLIVQWETGSKCNEGTLLKYKLEWFPLAKEVIILDYMELLADSYYLTEEKLLSTWTTRLQLPYPKKFNWTEWRKKEGYY